MRTTIELTDEQRAALLSVAARRGLRGYSSVIQEAVAQYLKLPKPEPPRKPPSRAKRGILEFLCDGFTTNRKDGSVRHDDYIYRKT